MKFVEPRPYADPEAAAPSNAAGCGWTKAAPM
jgi:hypothetical protein